MNVLSLISHRLDNYYQIQTNATVITVATVPSPIRAAPNQAPTKRGLKVFLNEENKYENC